MQSVETVKAEIEKLGFLEDVAPDDLSGRLVMFAKEVLSWTLEEKDPGPIKMVAILHKELKGRLADLPGEKTPPGIVKLTGCRGSKPPH